VCFLGRILSFHVRISMSDGNGPEIRDADRLRLLWVLDSASDGIRWAALTRRVAPLESGQGMVCRVDMRLLE
jgi:hypothetical protein